MYESCINGPVVYHSISHGTLTHVSVLYKLGKVFHLFGVSFGYPAEHDCSQPFRIRKNRSTIELIK